MNAISYIFGCLCGLLAVLCSRTKSSAFWPLAVLSWERSRYVTESPTGPYPFRSLWLRLVDCSPDMPNAEQKLIKALQRPNARLVAYCMLVLKRMGKLDATIIENLAANANEPVLIANGQFAYESSLGKYAEELLNGK